MVKQSLNGTWRMKSQNGNITAGQIPGSVYSFLYRAGKMEDPFFRENELQSLALMDQDYSFEREFDVDPDILSHRNQVLRFDGIDTLADVFLNGVLLGHVNNFHRYWEFDAAGLIKETGNSLIVSIHSPTRYIAVKDQEEHYGGSVHAMKGFPYLRKPHCMFGWDWGPRLPDMGIWGDVSILSWNASRIDDVKVRQMHAEGQVDITVDIAQTGNDPFEIILLSPDGEKLGPLENGAPFSIRNPQLWWPNGLGKQPLYTVRVTLQDGEETEIVEKRIGLRTLTMSRKKDQWGESFAHEVNGRTFFGMGADYIPEDNIFSRITPERTRKLLKDCKEANFNVIRVWGGGMYPSNAFYDACDEFGLVVWQDLMFACANYPLNDEFEDNITEEIVQNVRRLRHHASLGLWCGNNEMEQYADVRGFDGNDKTRAYYLIQNEYIIPKILRKEDPDTFYWPSSPSSGGHYTDPQSPDMGDTHYWTVWHSGAPFTAYRKHYFRYMSEFGFQSFPDFETVKKFTLPKDRNIFSRVMERHQRNPGANGKIMTYLSQNYLYPAGFENLLYASQLLQAEAVQYGVEHFRRNRNDDRCMGAIYWQLNDIWPTASWASIDYYGHWKALHYYAKRFFAPVMISCEEESEVTTRTSTVAEPSPNISTARLCVTNEGWNAISGTAEWELRDPESNIILSGTENVVVNPFSSLWLERMDFSDTDYHRNHLSFRFIQNDSETGERVISEGTVLFTTPKHYEFKNPDLKVSVEGDTVTVRSDAFARAVEVYTEDGYCRFSDNFFHMERGERTIRVVEGKVNPDKLRARSVYDIR